MARFTLKSQGSLSIRLSLDSVEHCPHGSVFPPCASHMGFKKGPDFTLLPTRQKKLSLGCKEMTQQSWSHDGIGHSCV